MMSNNLKSHNPVMTQTGCDRAKNLPVDIYTRTYLEYCSRTPIANKPANGTETKPREVFTWPKIAYSQRQRNDLADNTAAR